MQSALCRACQPGRASHTSVTCSLTKITWGSSSPRTPTHRAWKADCLVPHFTEIIEAISGTFLRSPSSNHQWSLELYLFFLQRQMLDLSSGRTPHTFPWTCLPQLPSPCYIITIQTWSTVPSTLNCLSTLHSFQPQPCFSVPAEVKPWKDLFI